MKDFGEVEHEKLSDVVNHLEEEARMVLPGIQALFGFQLVAVFNQRFTSFSPANQQLHFLALVCTACSVVLVMAPAAYHRQAEPRQISDFFCRLGTWALSLSLLPLGFAISIDLYLIARLLFRGDLVPLLTSGVFLLTFLAAWFAFPQWVRATRKGGNHARVARRRAG